MVIRGNRPRVTPEALSTVLAELTTRIDQEVDIKGDKAFVSSHECLGSVTEEYMELTDAVRDNDPAKYAREMQDIAVTMLWALASIEVDALDW